VTAQLLDSSRWEADLREATLRSLETSRALMDRVERSRGALTDLRTGLQGELTAARRTMSSIHDHADRAVAELSRPRPRTRVRRGDRGNRTLDFCDRETWYLHVRFARRRAPDALESLVRLYQEDVDRQARRIGTRASNDDLVQVAREALVLALHRFDPFRRKPFPPFARLTVDGTLRRYLRDQGYAIRPSRRIYELTPRLRQTSDWLTQELGRAPMASELADALDVTVDEVLEVLASTHMRSPLSLDRPVGEDGYTLAETAGTTDGNLGRALDRRALIQVMSGLPAKDRDLLDRYFLKGQTQQQIADDIGVSQMHVSRSLARILRRLRARGGSG